MRSLVRAGLVAAAAAGFCVALSLSASADVVEPKSAYQPASVGLLQEEAAAAAMPDAAEADPAAEAAAKKEPKPEPKPEKIVPATPAPEQVVRQVPAHLTQNDPVRESPSVAHRVVAPLRTGLQHIGATLGRVVSACEVGLGAGSGGPVLVLAVLGMAIPFIRRRVLMTRWATDEDMPEFLFAGELTPPG